VIFVPTSRVVNRASLWCVEGPIDGPCVTSSCDLEQFPVACPSPRAEHRLIQSVAARRRAPLGWSSAFEIMVEPPPAAQSGARGT
jgi:hypothetical protein